MKEVLELTPDGKVRVKEKKRSKYGNKRVQYGDLWFDSHAELKRWLDLKIDERAGNIRKLRRQTNWPLYVNGDLVTTYRDDFDYETRLSNGSINEWLPVIEDVKGSDATQTPEFLIKKRLMKAIHGIDILITGKGVK